MFFWIAALFFPSAFALPWGTAGTECTIDDITSWGSYAMTKYPALNNPCTVMASLLSIYLSMNVFPSADATCACVNTWVMDQADSLLLLCDVGPADPNQPNVNITLPEIYTLCEAFQGPAPTATPTSSTPTATPTSSTPGPTPGKMDHGSISTFYIGCFTGLGMMGLMCCACANNCYKPKQEVPEAGMEMAPPRAVPEAGGAGVVRPAGNTSQAGGGQAGYAGRAQRSELEF